ncbi:MAG: hypothetical protein ACP5UI_04730 [Thermoprotei archaeon]
MGSIRSFSHSGLRRPAKAALSPFASACGSDLLSRYTDEGMSPLVAKLLSRKRGRRQSCPELTGL